MHIPKHKRSLRGFGLATAKEIEGRDRAYSTSVNADFNLAQIQSVAPIALAAGVDVSVVDEIKESLTCGSITYLDITDWGIPNPDAPPGVLKHCDPASPFFNQSKLSCRDRLWLKTNHPMLDHKFEGRVFALKATYRYSACYTVVVNSPEDLDRIREWVDDLNEMGMSWIDDVDERVTGPAEFDVEGRARRKEYQEELKRQEAREFDEMLETFYASPEGVMRLRAEDQDIRGWQIDKLECNEIAIEDIPPDQIPEGGLPALLAKLKAEFAAYELLYDRDGRERTVEGETKEVKKAEVKAEAVKGFDGKKQGGKKGRHFKGKK